MKARLVSLIVVAMMLFSACSNNMQELPSDSAVNSDTDSAASEPVEEQQGGETDTNSTDGMTFYQAPMLDGMSLPAIEERLPDTPQVVEVIDQIGVYGGTINKPTTSVSNYLLATNNGESFFSLAYPMTDGAVQPNIAESWEWEEDGKVLVINLRKGLKWSDGTPVTTEDWEFTWNDVWNNENSLVVMPGAFMLDSVIPETEIVDEDTFKLIYPESYYYAEQAIASITSEQVLWPKHYLAEYHPEHNDDSSWENFANKCTEMVNGRMSVALYPWILEEENYVAGQSITLTRNPYYWKVDTDGNQLPYADEVMFHIIEDRDTLALRCVSGEMDTDGMWLNAAHLQLLMDNKEERGYEVGWWESVVGMAMYFNMESEDAQLQEIFRDVNFRRAFSLLMDREDLNQTVFNGMLDITGTSFHNQTVYATDTASGAWADFDVEQAKQILVDAGYVDSDGNGILESPSGRELSIIVDVAADHSMYIPILQIMLPTYAEAGIELVLNAQSHDMVVERRDSGLFEINVWDGDAMEDPMKNVNNLVSWNIGEENAPTGPFWNMEQANNPLDKFDDFQSALLEAKKLPYEDRVVSIQQAGDIMADECWFVYTGSYVRPYYVSGDLVNHPLEAIRTDVSTPFMLYQVSVNR